MNAFTASIAVAALAGSVHAAAFVGFDGDDMGLISYHNTFLMDGGLSADANLSENEVYDGSVVRGVNAFHPMTRAAFSPRQQGEARGGTMSSNIVDDSVQHNLDVLLPGGFPSNSFDPIGFAGVDFNDNGFFGISATQFNVPGNAFNVATFVLDISGMTDLHISADFIANGNFQLIDLYEFTYAIDDASPEPLFTTGIDAGAGYSWTMDDGDVFSAADPLLVNGVQLSDEFQNIGVDVPGEGSRLTITIGASTRSQNALGIDNLLVVPAPGTAVLAGLAGLGPMRRRRA